LVWLSVAVEKIALARRDRGVAPDQRRHHAAERSIPSDSGDVERQQI
jgi:hypothetical protein